jgi:hypothetical protein
VGVYVDGDAWAHVGRDRFHQAWLYDIFTRSTHHAAC